ncbi:protein crumbs homolog 1 isoform X2 [Pyxicephalus adspersus]|uniref:protein crumbs homolog 1 isoform X2 n=1 Tax=Pyxicephalus adspersus TaxID=30357 RepID=UPI003B5A256A
MLRTDAPCIFTRHGLQHIPSERNNVDTTVGQHWMMEQQNIPLTCCLSLTVLMLLQVICIVGEESLKHCSFPPCKYDKPCTSLIDCDLYDPCLSDPCPKNATCQVTLDAEAYECRCQAGFKGNNCEIPMRRCHRNICKHGGQCYMTDRGSTCFCAVGYKGTFCETPEDECLWNPCQNGAVCRERGNGQACYCVPGFQGALCNIEVDECISNPCKHGGTCLNQIGRYTCVCPPEFTGRDCEVDFDECSSGPCLNGATCHDLLGSFSCTCRAGFSGDVCDVNINECESSPCLNGGICVDKNNGYQCNCWVGYSGTNCEVSTTLCSSQPCQNNATCIEDSVSFKCLCWPGYTGSLCETEIHMCRSQPCKFGMECVELPWFNGSVKSNKEEEQFSGYICICGSGLSGVHCEQDINECESNPCQNGGTCENLHGTYTCHCRTIKDARGLYYGGSDCTEVLRGCEKQTCYNGGSCLPYILDGKHYHTCLCPVGFTGPDCQLQTTFSFNGKTILPIRNITIQPQRGSLSNISLSFSTVQTTAVIFSFGTHPASMTLYLENCFLFLDFLKNTQWTTRLHLSHNVSDNLWHTVEIVISDSIQLKLLDPSCDTTCVTQSSYNGPTNIEFQDILIGGIQLEKTREGDHNNGILEIQTWFVGCLRDLRVGSTGITEEVGKSAGVEVGCKRHDHCENHPCENRGKCINLWISYYCDCFRPYRGINCSTEYEAAEFGHGNVSSYAVFHTLATHMDDITLSAFVRPEHDSGLLFALGNSSFYDITVFIEGGRLTAKAGSGIILKGETSIHDFHFHLVSLKLTKDTFEVYDSSSPLAQIPIPINRPQTSRALYVGGLVDPLRTILSGGYFKGCIQDLRMDDKPLEFFPSSKLTGNPFLSNVTKGCTSDCTSAGKRCEQNWCQLNRCPTGSVCQAVPSGYECISSAFLSGEGNGIIFRSNGNITRDLTNLTISFRTLKSDCVLLYANREPERITISIQNKKLHFYLQSGNGLSAVNLLSVESVSDSQWHNVSLSMVAPGLQYSLWQMEIDGKPEMIISSHATGNLNFLKEGTEIYVGVNNNGSNRNFIGCLGTVLIEGIHLPYITDSDYLTGKTQREQFVKISPESVVIGCLLSDPCVSQPCKFGGSCNDVFTHPVCTCPAWTTGAFCEGNVTECLSNPCVHGSCIAVHDGYKCQCEDGYSGTNCEHNICHGHLCRSGATCIAGTAGYFCLCPANFTGLNCSMFSQYETSALSLVRIFNKMPSTVCGDEKKNITCYNYSNCTEVNGVLGCSCWPGFVGERCETDYDECESNPCLNGGICQNLPNAFDCYCDLNFAGQFCEIDLSDFLPPGVFTAVASVVLALFFAVCAGLCIFIAVASMRSNQGTYSPSRQEKEGSRVEMWNIVQPPPLERLI